jgi:hypothetical protein
MREGENPELDLASLKPSSLILSHLFSGSKLISA